MEQRFYIMHLWQTGNIGSHNIAKADINPKEGFLTHADAERHMITEAGKERNQNKGSWELKQSGYMFTIMPIFTVK